jgi:hypothetical protein
MSAGNSSETVDKPYFQIRSLLNDAAPQKGMVGGDVHISPASLCSQRPVHTDAIDLMARSGAAWCWQVQPPYGWFAPARWSPLPVSTLAFAATVLQRLREACRRKTLRCGSAHAGYGYYDGDFANRGSLHAAQTRAALTSFIASSCW